MIIFIGATRLLLIRMGITKVPSSFLVDGGSVCSKTAVCKSMELVPSLPLEHGTRRMTVAWARSTNFPALLCRMATVSHPNRSSSSTAWNSNFIRMNGARNPRGENVLEKVRRTVCFIGGTRAGQSGIWAPMLSVEWSHVNVIVGCSVQNKLIPELQWVWRPFMVFHASCCNNRVGFIVDTLCVSLRCCTDHKNADLEWVFEDWHVGVEGPHCRQMMA